SRSGGGFCREEEGRRKKAEEKCAPKLPIFFLLPSSFFLLPSSFFLLPSSFFLLPPRESLPALPSKKGGRILRMWAIQGPAENFQNFPCHRSGSVQTRPIFQKAISREGK